MPTWEEIEARGAAWQAAMELGYMDIQFRETSPLKVGDDFCAGYTTTYPAYLSALVQLDPAAMSFEGRHTLDKDGDMQIGHTVDGTITHELAHALIAEAHVARNHEFDGLLALLEISDEKKSALRAAIDARMNSFDERETERISRAILGVAKAVRDGQLPAAPDAA